MPQKCISVKSFYTFFVRFILVNTKTKRRGLRRKKSKHAACLLFFVGEVFAKGKSEVVWYTVKLLATARSEVKFATLPEAKLHYP